MAVPEEKRAKNEYFSVTFDFSTINEIRSTGLKWRNEPTTYSLVEGEGLKVTPNPKTDFWLKTYRNPPVKRASGHCLLYKMSRGDIVWRADVSFSLNRSVRFDQAGIMVYSDDNNWLKAGIEIENDQPNMSCVVTYDESDWNYIEWPTSKDVEVRVTGTQYNDWTSQYNDVCECRVEYYNGERWCFLREGPIGLTREKGVSQGVSVGIMCCSQEETDVGMEAVFKSLSLSESFI